MGAPDWYADWRQAAFDDLVAKQDQLKDSHLLGAWPRYDYDLEAATMTFSDAAGPKVRADVRVVGTTTEQAWLWGWANPHLPAEVVVEGVERAKAFGAQHGIAELTTDRLISDDPTAMGWLLTAVAARILDAPGAYRSPSRNGGEVFLVYQSIEFVS